MTTTTTRTCIKTPVDRITSTRRRTRRPNCQKKNTETTFTKPDGIKRVAPAPTAHVMKNNNDEEGDDNTRDEAGARQTSAKSRGETTRVREGENGLPTRGPKRSCAVLSRCFRTTTMREGRLLRLSLRHHKMELPARRIEHVRRRRSIEYVATTLRVRPRDETELLSTSMTTTPSAVRAPGKRRSAAMTRRSTQRS